jgi:flavodoxin
MFIMAPIGLPEHRFWRFRQNNQTFWSDFILENHSQTTHAELGRPYSEGVTAMTIGIIVHSKTGHTLQVAEKLQTELAARGKSARIERIEASPDLMAYDALVLGSHTEGFALAPEMVRYLQNIPPLNGKKSILLITHFFPAHGMGGTQAIASMKSLVDSKNGKVEGEEIIDWLKLSREKSILESVKKIAELL